MDIKIVLDALYAEKYALLEKIAKLEVELESEKKVNETLEKGLLELQDIVSVLKG
ncbi:hypothetical protein [Helicobacter sp.]|uniref:hypothetical protein n=1 Tax=Helicobacter sp. TaxID=218 RepID=UPI0025C1F0DB|nr:hypothetical protein [Helicobacter sp.]MCI5969150.1 hypothetical protein [Helicobacter sp.]